MTRHKDTHAAACMHLALFPFLPFRRFHSTRRNLFLHNQVTFPIVTHRLSSCSAKLQIIRTCISIYRKDIVFIYVPECETFFAMSILLHVWQRMRNSMDSIIIANEIATNSSWNLFPGWLKIFFGNREICYFFFIVNLSFWIIISPGKISREFSIRGTLPSKDRKSMASY